ncbi:MAG: L,D-transpeptidase family protein [Candidatus Brocadiia bacterium]
MRRSWLALGVVVVVIAVVLVIQLRPRTRGATDEEDAGPRKGSITTPTGDASQAEAETVAEKPKETEGEPQEAEDEGQDEEPQPPEPQSVEEAAAKADAFTAAGKHQEAHSLLSRALAAEPRPDDPGPLKARINKLTEEIVFSSKPGHLSVTHEVARGDTLWKIAKQHTTTVGLIQRLNGLKSDTIVPGQKLKVIPGPFDAVVVKSDFKLTVYKEGLWIREFPVGLGKDGTTPVGEFVAGEKIPKPPYTAVYPHIPYDDKENNPLGTRWITIQGAGAGQYGIHGTWEPDSIGKERSKGCIRMLNKDVELVYDLMVRGKSSIVIKP